MKHRVIGIDLGTTYSAVATYDQDNSTSEILEDESGATTTPSVVGIDPTSRMVIVGEVAKRFGALNQSDTIIEIKREMGEMFTPHTLDKYNARNHYTEENPVRVNFNGQWMLPQEISAFILMRMKAIAEKSVGQEIRDAVITVPAYFTSNQKKATEDAAPLAGLYPRQLIAEPTAAAICYTQDRFDPERNIYLVYDLGGGTFDVSIIKVQETDVQVIATSGDHRLGGGDFDDAITHWALEEVKKQGLDLTNDPVARKLVKFAAEESKKLLSATQSTAVVVSHPLTGKSVPLTLSREVFEQLIDGLLQRSLTFVTLALKYAAEKGVARDALSGVLLVGGSTKIPKVRQLLQEYFNRGDEFVRTDGHPDHLVARGAALLAKKFEPSPHSFDIKKKPSASLVTADSESAMNVTLIAEQPLGVGVQEDRFDPLIARGTSIPVSKTKSYTNPDGAEYVIAPVYQGEGAYVYENTLIGEFRIGPMQRLPAGKHDFEVTFLLDQNGLLNVTINHKNEGKVYKGDFKHKTTVQGDDALVTMRQGLLSMFQSVPVSVPVPPPPPSRTAPPAAAAGAAAGAPPVGGETKTARPPGPPAQSPPAPASDGLPPGLLVEIKTEVKEEFKGILRRARKQLLRRIDEQLVDAYNDFAQAANEAQPDAVLTELADELEDVYSHVRWTP